MIFVLSCFDLAVVVTTHPVLIFSTVLWSIQIYRQEFRNILIYTFITFGSFSMLTLLTLNIERYLALAYPFFHRAAVHDQTKTCAFSSIFGHYIYCSDATALFLRENNWQYINNWVSVNLLVRIYLLKLQNACHR